MFHKKNSPVSIDQKQVNETLQNVFKACNQTPNGVAVDKLLQRKKELLRPYNIWIAVSALFLLLTFFSPIILNPISTRLDEKRNVANIVLVDHFVKDEHFTMTLAGDFIDYSSIYALDTNGQTLYPDSYSPSEGIVSIPYNGIDELNIFIFDYNANKLHLLLSPKD